MGIRTNKVVRTKKNVIPYNHISSNSVSCSNIAIISHFKYFTCEQITIGSYRYILSKFNIYTIGEMNFFPNVYPPR